MEQIIGKTFSQGETGGLSSSVPLYKGFYMYIQKTNFLIFQGIIIPKIYLKYTTDTHPSTKTLRKGKIESNTIYGDNSKCCIVCCFAFQFTKSGLCIILCKTV